MNPVPVHDHLARARALYDARRYDLAATSALDAIAQDPGDAQAHVILSLSYDRQGRLAEADASASRAIELQPQNARAHIARGVVRLSQRRWFDALTSFRESARLDPESGDAFRLAAVAQINLNHYHDARATIARALEIDPDAIASREVHSIVLRALGRTREAEIETANVLRMHPESILGLSQEGLLRLQRGDPARARAAFREALRLDPNSKSVRAGYERVITQSTPYADWCGPRLIALGALFFFASGPAANIAPNVGLASLATAFVVWIANRPLALEALRHDEIGRTFRAPVAFARNRIALVYAGLAELSLVPAVAAHLDAAFAFTLGCLGAAIAATRSTRPSIAARVRTIYLRGGHAIAAGSAFVAIAGIARPIVDSSARSAGYDVATTAGIATMLLAWLVFVTLDLVFVLPPALAKISERLRRR